jgi:hypothetical protein
MKAPVFFYQLFADSEKLRVRLHYAAKDFSGTLYSGRAGEFSKGTRSNEVPPLCVSFSVIGSAYLLRRAK